MKSHVARSRGAGEELLASASPSPGKVTRASRVGAQPVQRKAKDSPAQGSPGTVAPAGSDADAALFGPYDDAPVQRTSEGAAGGSEAAPAARSMLRTGASGPDVEHLQTKLNDTIEAGLVVDGKFGPATLRAVRVPAGARAHR